MDFNSILEDLSGIPRTLLRALKFYLGNEGKSLLDSVRRAKVRRIIFTGHTYNYFASLIPFYFINSRYNPQLGAICSGELSEKICKIIEIDSFVSYFRPELHKDTAVVFISASGNPVQIRHGIDKLINAGFPRDRIWAVTDNPDSYLAEKAGLVLPMKAGREEIMGTKTYINTVFVLYLMARAFMNHRPLTRKIEEEVREMCFEMKFYGQEWGHHTSSIVNFFGGTFDFLYFISKGASLSTAYWSALACKSYARLYGEGIGVGLFLHGPFQIVDDSFRCVVICGDERNTDDVLRLIELITEKLGKGKVLLINNSRLLSAKSRANKNVYVFEHTTKNGYISPIFEATVIQYLILKLAGNRGII